MAPETGPAARGAAQVTIGPASVLSRRRRGHTTGRPAPRSGRSGNQGRLARDELLLRAHDRARGLLVARQPTQGTSRATARRQVSGMRKRSCRLLTCLTLVAASAQAQSVGESPLGSAVERQLPMEQPFAPWARDPEQIRTEAGDRLEPRQVLTESFETVKLKNVIPPIHFESGVAKIPDNYVETLRKALEGLRDRRNVRLHLVGHADNQGLSPALARTFGDNAGLSRERAGEVAEFLKRALQLKPEALAYEWAGDTHAIASNDTAEGRALNRRVEVEVWYDQPKARAADQEVLVRQQIKQVKICRMQTLCKLRFKEGAARRARVSNVVPPLHYDQENVQVSPEFVEQIKKALNNLRDKSNVVVKFIGYTDEVALTGRDERIYGDLVALSKARAHRVALAVQEALKLPGTAFASDGRGAVAPL
ncbi:MAG: OmpA family protein, partial [Gammaproteobacteria bacterium]